MLDWLEKCTFPMERKFADIKFAERTYRSVVRRVIDSGVSFAFALYPFEIDQTVDDHMLLLWHFASGSYEEASRHSEREWYAPITSITI